MAKVIVGCEESQMVTIELRSKGIEAYSCDLLPCSGGHPEWHIILDVLIAIEGGELTTESGELIFIDKWDAGIFFPVCTYLTCSAEWAYKEPPYHQKINIGVLTGNSRRLAREQSIGFVKKLYNSKIKKVSIENPVGVLSTRFMKPTQIIQPYQFGDNASKKTCLWLKGLPPLLPTEYFEPRYVKGKPRWGNQTDSGQNNVPPSPNQAKIRSKTYNGIARAMAEQWSNYILNENTI